MGVDVAQVYTLSDGTTVTHEQLRERVKVVEPGVVVMKEIRGATVETLHVINELFVEAGKPFERVVHLVDLSDADAPSAAYRQAVVNWMREAPCIHTCFVQPGFVVIRVALRFMIGRAKTSMSIHKTYDEALAAARTHL